MWNITFSTFRKMNWIIITAFGVFILCAVFGYSREQETNELLDDRYEMKNQCIELLRNQVNMEMHASLVYMNMAAHFNRNSVARKGFAKFFEENAKEERHHAQKLIDFLNLRGSHFTHFDIEMPKITAWISGLHAIKDAISLEKKVNNQLNHIHDMAEKKCNDPHLMDFLEREFLEEQVESIDTLLRHEAVISAMKEDILAEYLFDKQLLHGKLEL